MLNCWHSNWAWSEKWNLELHRERSSRLHAVWILIGQKDLCALSAAVRCNSSCHHFFHGVKHRRLFSSYFCQGHMIEPFSNVLFFCTTSVALLIEMVRFNWFLSLKTAREMKNFVRKIRFCRIWSSGTVEPLYQLRLSKRCIWPSATHEYIEIICPGQTRISCPLSSHDVEQTR